MKKPRLEKHGRMKKAALGGLAQQLPTRPVTIACRLISDAFTGNTAGAIKRPRREKPKDTAKMPKGSRHQLNLTAPAGDCHVGNRRYFVSVKPLQRVKRPRRSKGEPPTRHTRTDQMLTGRSARFNQRTKSAAPTTGRRGWLGEEKTSHSSRLLGQWVQDERLGVLAQKTAPGVVSPSAVCVAWPRGQCPSR